MKELLKDEFVGKNFNYFLLKNSQYIILNYQTKI